MRLLAPLVAPFGPLEQIVIMKHALPGAIESLFSDRIHLGALHNALGEGPFKTELIAAGGLAIGCETAYIYVRGEYIAEREALFSRGHERKLAELEVAGSTPAGITMYHSLIRMHSSGQVHGAAANDRGLTM